MKTIQVTDEVYEFLKNCKEELNTQDNRCTRNPLYTIWHHIIEYGIADDFSEGEVYIWDDDEFQNLEDLFNFMDNNDYEDLIIKVYNYYNPQVLVEVYNEDTGIKEKVKEWFCDRNNSFEIIDLMSELTSNTFYSVGIRKKQEQVVNGACFSFFEKDAFDHIKMNGHNIKGKTYTYADSLYRTPRMEKLLSILKTELLFADEKE